MENWGSQAGVLFGSTVFYYLNHAMADFDQDNDVDVEDFDHFEACATGPEIAQTDPDCSDAKLDDDEDVDQEDFGIFERCVSGSDEPADPACALLP
jgi:hypothetical protein